MDEITGSCLCGSVAYAVSGPFTQVVNCHCGLCRKAHASAYRSRMTARSERFGWLRRID